MHTLADWTWCRCWLPLLGAIAGLPLLGDRGTVGVHVGGLDGVSLALLGCHCWAAIAGDIGGGWVHTLADWTWCRCLADWMW